MVSFAFDLTALAASGFCEFCAEIDRLFMQNSNRATASATRRPPMSIKKMPATLLSDSSLRASCLSLCLHSVRSYHHLLRSRVMLPFSISDRTARFMGSLKSGDILS